MALPTDQGPSVSADDSSAQARTELAGLSEVAAGDHQNCAIKFRLSQPPINLEDAGQRYDRAYLNLAGAVTARQSDTPEPIQFVKAHSCFFNGQRFAHLILKQRGQLVSVLVTDLNPNNSPIQTTGSQSDLNKTVAACLHVKDYQVACFKTPRHANFIVSGLNEKENLAITRTLAPTIYEHIMRVENIA